MGGSDVDDSTRRPRPPRLIWPPFRPADRASSEVHSCAVPFWCAARPPLLAISRCFSGDIEANPRRSRRSPPRFRAFAGSFMVVSRSRARPSRLSARRKGKGPVPPADPERAWVLVRPWGSREPRPADLNRKDPGRRYCCLASPTPNADGFLPMGLQSNGVPRKGRTRRPSRPVSR